MGQTPFFPNHAFLVVKRVEIFLLEQFKLELARVDQYAGERKQGVTAVGIRKVGEPCNTQKNEKSSFPEKQAGTLPIVCGSGDQHESLPLICLPPE